MNAFVKRVVSLAVTSALALGGLVACGQSGQPEPSSTQDVLERYTANEKHTNYHADTNMDIEVALLGQSIPITATMSLDYAGDDSHGTMKAEAMGQEQTSEMYITKEDDTIVQYQTDDTGDNKTWVRSELSSSSLVDQLTAQDILKDAQFAKTEDGYTLTVSGDKIFEALSSPEIDMGEILNGLDEATVRDALKDSEAVYTFDKDCLLTGCTYDVDFDYNYGDLLPSSDAESATDANLSLTMGLKISVNITISGYGDTDPTIACVPKEVRDEAVDVSELDQSFDELTNLVGNETEETAA